MTLVERGGVDHVEGSRQAKDLLIIELVNLRQRLVGLENSSAEHRWLSDLFGALFTDSPIAIYLFQDGKIRIFDSQFQIDTGYSEDELIRPDPASLVVPEERNNFNRCVGTVTKGDSLRPRECRITSATRSTSCVTVPKRWTTSSARESAQAAELKTDRRWSCST